jgi:histidyl-tRNA synthetase
MRGKEMNKFGTPRGTQDFLPDEMAVRNHVEGIIRKTFDSFGFQQIQTPVFEEFALLAARSGEEIRNSMFTFRSDQVEYALRPEMTAPVCRLIASGKFSQLPLPYKVYYIGECFRYGRPQAGRYREFTQAGMELMGSSSPLADAEVMAVAVQTLKSLGINQFKLKVGNIGVFRDLLAEDLDYEKQSRVINQIDRIMSVWGKCDAIKMRSQLERDDIEYVKGEVSDLYSLQEEGQYEGSYEILPSSDYSEKRVRDWLDRLPAVAEDTYKFVWSKSKLISPEKAELLIQVSRVRGPFSEVSNKAKSLLNRSAAQKAIEQLAEVCEWLEKNGVTGFEVVLGIARGLDFYTGTVFEIDSPLLGAQKQICGGGRYDNLVAEFGGPSVPATGFAFGFDRVVEVFEKSGGKVSSAQYDAYVSVSEKALLPKAVELAAVLRRQNIRTGVPLMELDLREQLGHAAKVGSTYTIILGTEEILKDMCKLRNMGTRKEELVPITEVGIKILEKLEK